MRLLALESSTQACSVALRIGDRTLLRQAPHDARNSEVMLPMVRELMAEAGLAFGLLDGIAFGAGPGAFTGLRVACGTAQGLAFAADLPVVAVGSLETLAESLRAAHAALPATPVLACLDARMGDVYWSLLAPVHEDWRVLCPPALDRPEQLRLPLEIAVAIGIGEGFLRHRDPLLAGLGHRIQVAAQEGRLPRADALAALGVRRLQAGQGVAAEFAQPVYLRDQVALTTAQRAAAAAERAQAAKPDVERAHATKPDVEPH